MSKKVELVQAEVQTQYNSEEVLREFSTEKGATIFSWSVKTKVNDKAEKSPVVFDTCSMFAENDEEKQYVRDNVKLGAILNIKGFQDRRKAAKPGPDGKYAYYDQINVKEIQSITGAHDTAAQQAGPSDDDLPF